MASNDQASWVKDGTAEVEPVTTETPSEEVVEVEAKTEVAETVETDKPDEATGTVEETKTEEAEEVAQKFIEGKLGDEVFQLPEGVLVPLKRGDETEYVDLAELVKGSQAQSEIDKREADLHRERSDFGRDRKSYAIEAAKLEERQKHIAEREEQLRSAFSDPEKAQKFQDHLHMMETNPLYRETFDRDLSNRETTAERDQLLAEKDDVLVREGVEKAFGWIDEISGDYPGVDTERVTARFGQELTTVYDASGRVVRESTARLDLADVRRIFESEAAVLASAREPLETRIDELSAKVASVIESKSAEEQNETTQHAVKRAKTTPVATGAGAPAKGYTPPGKFGPNELAAKTQEWASVR